MELFTLGIDLAKTTFHLVGMNQRGEVVWRKRFSRSQLLHFTANLKVDLIGMEACGGSHFLGRAVRDQGHEVRLIPAQYVKPYVKTNKSDYIDGEAIAEAVGRPRMRFVPVKSEDQLDLQSLHRVRERWVMRRTAMARAKNWASRRVGTLWRFRLAEITTYQALAAWSSRKQESDIANER
jgi:transposase